MKGYLKGLVTRGLADAGRAGVQPLVRSASPIAQEDQRLGVPGFEGFQSMTMPLEGTSEGRIETAGDVPSYKPSPFIAAQNIDGETIRREAARRGDSEGLTPPGSNASRQVIGREPAREEPSNLRFSRQGAAPNIQLDEKVIGPHNQLTDVQQAGQSNNIASEKAGYLGATAHLSARKPGAPASPFNTETETSETPRRRSVEAAPHLLEPSPRAIRAPQNLESSSPAFESAGMAEQGPRVVIGRINVEVVSPATEPKSSAASRSGPLTAASVSVIGPLTRGVRSNQRLSLRHR